MSAHWKILDGYPKCKVFSMFMYNFWNNTKDFWKQFWTIKIQFTTSVQKVEIGFVWTPPTLKSQLFTSLMYDSTQCKKYGTYSLKKFQLQKFAIQHFQCLGALWSSGVNPTKTFFIHKQTIFPFIAVKLDHFMNTSTYFPLLQTLKFNSENLKARKMRFCKIGTRYNLGLFSSPF